MTTTNNLGITLVEQSQSQKEVTVNAAIVKLDAILNRGVIDKDLSTPPISPAAGDIYIVAASATSTWATHENDIAYYEQVWKFLTPAEGMCLWVNDENLLYIWSGVTWDSYPSSLNNITLLGINATADLTNKLSVKSNAILLDNNGSSSQVKVNKNAVGDTASHLFQVGYSGRAEFGLIGDDDFHIKVSPDGSSWNEAIIIDKSTGNVSFKKDVSAKRGIVSVTVAKTFAITDEQSFQKCTSASATTLTIPPNSSVAFNIGTEIDVYQEGVGLVNIAAGAGVTINSKSSFLNISSQYGYVSLKKTATDVWALTGDLA